MQKKDHFYLNRTNLKILLNQNNIVPILNKNKNKKLQIFKWYYPKYYPIQK